MSDTILNIENITKSFPRVVANKKVTFDIKKNAVHAILGLSPIGATKTKNPVALKGRNT